MTWLVAPLLTGAAVALKVFHDQRVYAHRLRAERSGFEAYVRQYEREHAS